MTKFTRRRLLRGMMQGSAVAVALPLLDIFLDGNGQALASGAPIPTRFGTWFWGCGVNTARFFPTKVGKDYDLKDELKPIAPFKDKVSVFSNFNCILDGKPNLVHWSGAMATLTACYAWRFGDVLRPRWLLFTILAPLCASLWFSTVYLRHHWVVDVFAGWALGLACAFTAPRVRRAFERLTQPS